MSDLAEAGVDGSILMKRITSAFQSLHTPRFSGITSVKQLCHQLGKAVFCTGGINVPKACAQRNERIGKCFQTPGRFLKNVAENTNLIKIWKENVF